MSAMPSNLGGMRRKPRQVRSQERVNRILDVSEELFISQGYATTTTNAIAARAQVPIGSLYQFFPDKAAILQALAVRYGNLLYQQLTAIDEQLPLLDYINQAIDTTYRFFSDNPGYHAVFMEVQGTIRELEKIDEAADARLTQNLAESLAKRSHNLAALDCQAIAFVMVKTIGNLLWLSLNQEKTFQQRLLIETKRLVSSYLQSYFPPDHG
jgi:AcrR family transcriptional regulator